RNRPGNYMKPLYITVHNTANTAKGANAASHASFVKRSSTGVSWHYTVDENVIYQHLPLNENGWHAGDGRGTGNMKSIGIEICENADGNFEKA
ncbi:peptidoglycan recognition protein family protein, partial [Bacillus pumilus]